MPIDYDKYNPIEGGTFRNGQKEAIEGMVKHYENGIKVVQVDAPTAAGKTVQLNAFGNILLKEFGVERVMFTSPQVALIQNGNLFGLPKLVGKSNYPCLGMEGCNAEDCPFTSKEAGWSVCIDCPYRIAKAEFNKAKFSATTFARFQVDPSIKGSVDVALIDESTNLFGAMIDESALELPKNVALDINFVEALQKYHDELVIKALQKQVECKELRDAIKESPKKPTKEQLKQLKKVQAEYNKYDRNATSCAKALRYISIGEKYVVTNEDDWVFDKLQHKKVKVTKYYFKLLDAKRQFKELSDSLEMVVLASGTPTTHLISNRDDYKVIEVAHPIDASRRKVYYTPIGNMNAAQREQSAPKLAKEIVRLHDTYHANTIVHCGAYGVAKLLYDNIDISKHNIVLQDQKDRKGSLDQWQRTPDSIFLSVKYEEGIDLIGEKYPLNIVAKLAFPPFKDRWVESRKETFGSEWYDTTTGVALIQACGRTTRSPTDYSETYILDASFRQFYNRRKNSFPDWFKEALVM